MFGKEWDRFWDSFDKMMSALPAMVDKAVASGTRKVTISNGDIVLRGNFKSLRINGRLIRIPKEILEGNNGQTD